MLNSAGKRMLQYMKFVIPVLCKDHGAYRGQRLWERSHTPPGLGIRHSLRPCPRVRYQCPRTLHAQDGDFTSGAWRHHGFSLQQQMCMSTSRAARQCMLLRRFHDGVSMHDEPSRMTCVTNSSPSFASSGTAPTGCPSAITCFAIKAKSRRPEPALAALVQMCASTACILCCYAGEHQRTANWLYRLLSFGEEAEQADGTRVATRRRGIQQRLLRLNRAASASFVVSAARSRLRASCRTSRSTTTVSSRRLLSFWGLWHPH